MHPTPKSGAGDAESLGAETAVIVARGKSSMSKLRKSLPITAAFLITACGTSDNSYQLLGNVEKPKEVSSPESANVRKSDFIPSTRIETLDDFERSEVYRDYKLRKEDGWKLNTGAYNNSYETSSVSDINIEIQTIENKVVGFGIVFDERDNLQEVDLNFVYKLLQSIDTKAKLDHKIREYIKINAEKPVFQIKQANPTTFGKFKIYAGRVGPEQTISIEKI
jgi:hypothetical protein